MTYNKTRNDTTLRVAFHTVMSQQNAGYCNEYSTQFGGKGCLNPAPIVNSLFNNDYRNLWHSVPAELSGFCKSTTDGMLTPGNIQISVHVNQPRSGGVTRTGRIAGSPALTSYLLVEEYCS